jgi:transposase-like protein
LYRRDRRWSDAEARVALTAMAESGLSMAAFARRAGLDPQRLYHWRRRLGGSEAPSFVEIHRLGQAPLEVVLRSGRVLRFAESIDAVALQRIVAALEVDVEC